MDLMKMKTLQKYADNCGSESNLKTRHRGQYNTLSFIVFFANAPIS